MKRILFATTLFAFVCGAAQAVSPTVGNYSRDSYGVSAPILPVEAYTDRRTVGASGYVSMTCPQGTGQLQMAVSPSTAAFAFKPNGTTCTTSNTTDGSACSKGETNRTRWWDWNAGQTFILYQAPSGTEIYQSCWAYTVN